MLVRPLEPDDIERVHLLRAQAFRVTASERDAPEMIPENFRVAEDGGAILGCLRIHRFGHFWGGRPVRAAGIASVAVAAEARGRGVGALLMHETLAELRLDGYPISSLYPATVPLYRSSGYGYGGVRASWRVPLDDLPRDSAPGVSPFTDADLDDVNACYERIARDTSGLVQRSPAWWGSRVISSHSTAPTFRYLVRDNGRVTGWIVYRIEESKDSWRSTMICRDLMWEDAAAGRALLALAALHRSTAHRLEWTGPSVDPIGDLLREDVAECDSMFRWMVRLVDVPAAIEARGYSPLADAQVAIEVIDPIFPANRGPWRIEVVNGSAKVTPADTAEATADAEAWASIWTGLHRARDVRRLGKLEASPQAIDALETIFAGPVPWIADFY